MKNQCVRIPGTAVVHEFLDDEVIIANLDSGIYYSARGAGIPIWELLVAGHSMQAAESLLLERYPAMSRDIGTALAAFVQQLCSEHLLIEAEGNMAPLTESEVHYPEAYQAPVLEKYDEMKDLLMLDPVHEVDEQGWPSRSTA